MIPITELTTITILLVLGIVLTFIAKKLRLPNVILLILAGYILSYFKFAKEYLVFSPSFVTSIAIIALIMIVFDSTSRFNLKAVSRDAPKTVIITLLNIILMFSIFPVATKYLFGLSWTYSFLLSMILIGTDPGAVLTMLADIKDHVTRFLKLESIVNTPFTVILPFLVLQISKTFQEGSIIGTFSQHIVPFSRQIITGIGTGIVIGLIIFRLMKKQYSEMLSPVTLIVSALATYILAEYLGGNGVLAVTTLGLLFGNVYITRKRTLRAFGNLFSNIFEIFVYILLGLSLSIPLTANFILMTLLLFAIYILLRIIATHFSLWNYFNWREKLFVSLNAAKGIAVAVVAFGIVSLDPKISIVAEIIFMFIIYSIILSSIMGFFAKYFLDENMIQKIQKKHSNKKSKKHMNKKVFKKKKR